MFKKNTSKDNKNAQEAVKVPNYGDLKIDEAKGKKHKANPFYRSTRVDP